MLSGGLDSAVALYWALKRGYSVDTMTFDYFRRGTRERKAALSLSKLLSKKRNHTVPIRFLREIGDIAKEDKGQNRYLANAPEGYISSRNVIIYGIATFYAETLGLDYIVGGHNLDDVRSFSDASEIFFEQFNRTTAMGLFSGAKTGRVVLPLAKLSKAKVVLLGQRLGVPFEKTWSCYRSGRKPCRKCPSCILRESAFKEAGVVDPLLLLQRHV